jgi:CubicO group peptidase (beta-lactamase class C family)
MVFGLGVFGQNVFVEPDSGLVIAKFSSQPLPLDPGFTALTHQGIDLIREIAR